MVAHEQPRELAAAPDEGALEGVPDGHLAVVVLQVRRVGVGPEVAPPAEVAVAEVAVVALRGQAVHDAPVDLAAHLRPVPDDALVDARRRLHDAPRPDVHRPPDDGVLADLGAGADPDRPAVRAHDGPGPHRGPRRDVDRLPAHEHGPVLDLALEDAERARRGEVVRDAVAQVRDEVPQPADHRLALGALLGHVAERPEPERTALEGPCSVATGARPRARRRPGRTPSALGAAPRRARPRGRRRRARATGR